MLTFEQIKELIELVSKNRLQSIEIERTGFRLRIGGQEYAERRPVVADAAVKAEGRSAAPAGEPQAVSVPVSIAPAIEMAHEPLGAPESDGQVQLDAHLLVSPIVGTFYAAPAPDVDPFVRIGDIVKKGQVLCIVEAMKLMNEIEADVDGEVVQVFPKNAQPVEYGEPLFGIKAH